MVEQHGGNKPPTDLKESEIMGQEPDSAKLFSELRLPSDLSESENGLVEVTLVLQELAEFVRETGSLTELNKLSEWISKQTQLLSSSIAEAQAEARRLIVAEKYEDVQLRFETNVWNKQILSDLEKFQTVVEARIGEARESTPLTNEMLAAQLLELLTKPAVTMQDAQAFIVSLRRALGAQGRDTSGVEADIEKTRHFPNGEKPEEKPFAFQDLREGDSHEFDIENVSIPDTRKRDLTVRRLLRFGLYRSSDNAEVTRIKTAKQVGEWFDASGLSGGNLPDFSERELMGGIFGFLKSETVRDEARGVEIMTVPDKYRKQLLAFAEFFRIYWLAKGIKLELYEEFVPKEGEEKTFVDSAAKALLEKLNQAPLNSAYAPNTIVNYLAGREQQFAGVFNQKAARIKSTELTQEGIVQALPNGETPKKSDEVVSEADDSLAAKGDIMSSLGIKDADLAGATKNKTLLDRYRDSVVARADRIFDSTDEKRLIIPLIVRGDAEDLAVVAEYIKKFVK